MKTINQNKKEVSIDQLLVKLKNEDSNYSKISIAVTIMYWIFIPLFGIKTFLEYQESVDITEVIKGICFILGFLILAIFFRRYYKKYKYVDYSLPTIQMLRQAVCRYKLFQKESIWILLALIVIDVGLTLDWMKNGTSILETQTFFLGAILFGFIIGLILWYVKYKPIRDEALKMIKEIEGE